MDQPLGLKICASLALVQGLAGLLRAFNWMQIGADLFSQGLLLLPAVGLVAILRGMIIATVALLYVLFFSTALMGKSWARWIGLVAVVVNLFLVLSALTHGAPRVDAMAWSAIPILLLCYLFSPAGRTAFRGAA